MATFSTIPYSYVPTRPRLKSTAARKPAPKQSGIFDELQCSKIAGVDARIRVEMSSFPSGASSTSDENEPHIEELLYSRLQKEKFIAKDSGPKETLRRVEESASEGREDFIDHSRSASGDNSGGDPDWCAEWILRPSGQLPWDTAFSASGDSALQVPADVGTSPSQLTLNGCLVGRVETLGKAWEPHLIDGCVKDTPGVAAYLLDVANLCVLSDLKFRDTNFSIYTNNDHRRQAHIRVPIADQEGYGMSFIRRATQECHQGYREVLEATKDSIDYLLGRKAAEPVKIPTNSNAKVSYLNMLGWQRDRKPFLAENGYVGLAPSHVEKDDVIVIFLGGKFPYVLRKKENGAFMFVGEAYVHGIMYGEFMQKEVAIKSFTME